MTDYIKKSFTVPAPGTESYRENYEQIDWKAQGDLEDTVKMPPSEATELIRLSSEGTPIEDDELCLYDPLTGSATKARRGSPKARRIAFLSRWFGPDRGEALRTLALIAFALILMIATCVSPWVP